MDVAEKTKILEDILGKTVYKGKTYANRLSADPKPVEVLPYLHRKATKRLRKKIAQNLAKYGSKYVQPIVLAEYYQRRMSKLGEVIVDHIRDMMSRPSRMRQMLPQRPVSATSEPAL